MTPFITRSFASHTTFTPNEFPSADPSQDSHRINNLSSDCAEVRDGSLSGCGLTDVAQSV